MQAGALTHLTKTKFMPKKPKPTAPPVEIKMFLRATVVVEQTERNKDMMTSLMNSARTLCALADGDPLLKLTTEVVQAVCRPKVSMDLLKEMPAVDLKPKTQKTEKNK
jgi:hypothetical protein